MRSPVLVPLLAAGLLATACDAAADAPAGGAPSMAATSPAGSIEQPPSTVALAETGASRAMPGPHRAWAISAIEPKHRAVLVPRNWRPGCPVPLASLRWLTVRYWGFDGQTHIGPLIVNERVAEDVRWVFRQIYHARFAIKHVALPARYRPKRDGWETTRSVTAGFNCRPATGNPGVWSEHAFGLAVDINPLQNPYVRPDGSVLRKAAKPYRDRSIDRPGMIREGDVVVSSFDAIGWGWGGRWTTIKDYMHFSLTGH